MLNISTFSRTIREGVLHQVAFSRGQRDENLRFTTPLNSIQYGLWN
jgi:hypothetical protein